MKFLVTGGAGYLGSVLVPKLLARGHQVRVIDIGYFGLGHLKGLQPQVELIRGDMRRVRGDRAFARDLLAGCDAVVHLAAISNDPSAELHPELTHQVNFETTAVFAEEAKNKRMRFLFSSSCSVYGEADGLLTEDGAVNPITVYAVSKVKSDQMLGDLADANWAPIILRNGTLFGYSPRMRFDLVVNIFSLYSVLKNKITVFGDGMQWRPFLHVGDCARAFIHFAENPPAAGQHVFNISHENMRVVDLIAVFQAINPRLEAEFLPTENPDNRDYAVDNRRMGQAGFQPLTSVRVGAEQLVDAIVSGLIPDPESIYYRNAKWLKELSRFDEREHADALNLMETLSGMRPR
ncbi:MAG TPA: SDR family oxidoreductase [Pirellulales bacterium]|nr:SDR family oxidoreductase [Pirellulales bacterium]